MAASLQFSGIDFHLALSGRKSHGRLLFSLKNFSFGQSLTNSLPAGLSCQMVRRDRLQCVTVTCCGGSSAIVEKSECVSEDVDGVAGQMTCVMKFGGSSVATAERMREVAILILSFPEERPVIVLSAMGRTTNRLLEVSKMFELHLPYVSNHFCFEIPIKLDLFMWINRLEKRP